MAQARSQARGDDFAPEAGRHGKIMKYTLPSLAYPYDALEPQLSREIVDLHLNAHHAAYVKGANKTLDDLAEARGSGRFDAIAQLERDLAFHASGHLLHSLLWRNLSPNGGGEPRDALAGAIDRDFGSFAAMKAQLNAACASLQGSGWGALCWEPLGGTLVVAQIHDHHANVCQGSMPILVIDMWEHAYYLQYRNKKSEWLDAYWQLVDWGDAAQRFARARERPFFRVGK